MPPINNLTHYYNIGTKINFINNTKVGHIEKQQSDFCSIFHDREPSFNWLNITFLTIPIE